MPTKVYVGNLPDNCSPDSLKGLFEPYGKINEVSVIKNFAFLHFEKVEEANNAVQDLHKSKMLGQQITVEISKSQGGPNDRRRDSDRRRDDRRDRDRRDRGGPRRSQPPIPLNPNPLGGILGAAPDNNVLNGLGIFSTLAVAAAAEQQKNELQKQSERLNQPDPDVRVRREAVHTRDVPNARELNLGDGYVIYERYYVDPSHPLLKGLPVPELPRVTDSFVNRDVKPRIENNDRHDFRRSRSPIRGERPDGVRDEFRRNEDYERGPVREYNY